MIEVNLKNRAASHTTLAFNSMCRFGDIYLGANGTGLYQLTGATDDGSNISSYIKTGKFDLGTERLKSIRYFYLGLETTGAMRLTIYVDGVEKLTKDFKTPGTGRQTVRVKVPRGLKGRYWEFKLENTDGCSFVLYSVQIFPVVLLSTH